MGKGIQRGELALSLAQLYEITGRLALQLDETVVPVVLTGDLRAGPERRTAAAQAFAVALNAGDFAAVLLDNPATGAGDPPNQTLAVVTDVFIHSELQDGSVTSSQRAFPVFMECSPVLLNTPGWTPYTPGQKNWRDTTLNRAVTGNVNFPKPFASIYSNAAYTPVSAPENLIGRFLVNARPNTALTSYRGQLHIPNVNVVLAPGYSLSISSVEPATATGTFVLTVTFWWREVPARGLKQNPNL